MSRTTAYGSLSEQERSLVLPSFSREGQLVEFDAFRSLNGKEELIQMAPETPAIVAWNLMRRRVEFSTVTSFPRTIHSAAEKFRVGLEKTRMHISDAVNGKKLSGQRLPTQPDTQTVTERE